MFNGFKMAIRRLFLLYLLPRISSGLGLVATRQRDMRPPWQEQCKALRRTAAAGFVAVLSSTCPPMQPAWSEASPAGVAAAAAVEEVWDMLDQYYYAPAADSARWKSSRSRLSAQASDHPDRVESLKRAALGSLGGDKYTRILNADEYEKLSRFDVIGIGLILGPDGSTSESMMRVVSPPLPGSSAAKVNIAVDDIVETIDGVSTKGLSSLDILQVVSEKGGNTATVTVRRGDEPPREYSLARSTPEIGDPIGRVAVSGDGVAYIRLREFNAKLAQRLGEEVSNLDGDVRRVVLDLRGNPGGAFQAAVSAASIFLPPDSPVVTVVEKQSQLPLKTPTTPAVPSFDGKVEIWVDSKSASASEIFAAALRDNCKAEISGNENSYGKGLIQAVFGFTQSPGGLVVTIAQYQTPSGKSINGIGVKPDLPLPFQQYLGLLGPPSLPTADEIDTRWTSLDACRGGSS